MRSIPRPRRFAGVALLLALFALPGGGTAAPAESRSRTLLDADWKFHAGEAKGAESVQFDDAAWAAVHLPHDYVREGTVRAPAVAGRPTTAEARAERNHGYIPHDTPGWYRRHLTVPASARGRVLRLDFDGAYRDSDVWLNGQLLGHHASGYTPFSYDITKVANVGGDNVISVRVDPREDEGWWYEGGGIYRHVWLTTLAPIHIAQWGTYVVATVPNGDAGAADEADLTLQTTIDAPSADYCDVLFQIVSPEGNSVAQIRTTGAAIGPGRPDVTQRIKIPRPQLWSLESPRLYELRTTLLRDGAPVDASTTTFGIRTLRFDPNRGFFLNGKHVEIYGLCCHQDFGGIGIAVPDNLQAWRVAQLKQAGANGWRTAHNPPSEALLEACDRMGMLVMDENRHLGDAFAAKTPPGTKAADLSDLATMIRRDRNHPSIIMWSMCNEEGLQGTPEGAAIFKRMREVVHQFDRTRPVTSAMHSGWLVPEGIADVEDIIGINYNTEKYDAVHQRHPDKMIFGSEDTNQKTTRGEYADRPAAGMSSQYNLSDKGWQAVSRRPFMAGSYTWTGFDYKGEPNPYGWPAISNNTGLFDLCGFPKDRFYYFQSCWTDKPMVHLVPSAWNGPVTPGEPVRVLAFTNARNVELFLNGQSLGRRDVERDEVAEWRVPFAPGQLVARAYANGNVVGSDTVETTGIPARIVVTLDPAPLQANGEDVVVTHVSIVDEKGRVVPNAANRVTFHLAGPGRIAGVSNGNPADHDADNAEQRNAFHGHVAAIVRAGTKPGTLQLTASSAGLAPGTATIDVRTERERSKGTPTARAD